MKINDEDISARKVHKGSCKDSNQGIIHRVPENFQQKKKRSKFKNFWVRVWVKFSNTKYNLDQIICSL